MTVGTASNSYSEGRCTHVGCSRTRRTYLSYQNHGWNVRNPVSGSVNTVLYDRPRSSTGLGTWSNPEESGGVTRVPRGVGGM